MKDLELYHKDGHIIDQETGKTLALISYFDEKDKEQKALGKFLSAAPAMLTALQITADVLYGDLAHYQDIGDKEAVETVKQHISLVNAAINEATGE